MGVCWRLEGLTSGLAMVWPRFDPQYQRSGTYVCTYIHTYICTYFSTKV